MTGSLQVIAGGAGGPQNGSAVLSDVRAGASAITSIRINADGTITYVGNGCSGPARWYDGTPPTYYCTNTVNSGTVPQVGAAALTPTTGTCLWQWTQITVGAAMTANCTLRIYSDAAGASLAATITYTVSAQRTS